jgi:exopolysaccharide production protein ExoZ
MEGLRGFAVLLVFLVHYESLLEPWIARDASLLALAHSLLIVGNAGVDLFFLLSGYLIYGSLLTRQQCCQACSRFNR